MPRLLKISGLAAEIGPNFLPKYAVRLISRDPSTAVSKQIFFRSIFSADLLVFFCGFTCFFLQPAGLVILAPISNKAEFILLAKPLNNSPF
jgi:hypothetical protein